MKTLTLETKKYEAEMRENCQEKQKMSKIISIYWLMFSMTKL